MISGDTYVSADGKVIGTLNHITGFTDFNVSVPEQQEGYYFPIKLTQTGTKMSLIKNGTPSKSNIDFDPEILLRVQKSDKWSIEVDDKEVISLDFSQANFAE